MTELRALIIDDEPLAHDVILAYCENVPFVTVAGQCYSATEALAYLAEHPVDLLFLDINMPMLTGLDLIKVLKDKPQIVITSAYEEYALESFALSVTDYLLKPFAFERFLQACNKCKEQHELQLKARQADTPPSSSPPLFIKVDKQQVQITLSDVSCFEAYGNYVKVWRDGQSLLTPRTLTSFVSELSEESFIRIHKSAIVNIQHIASMDSQKVTLTDGNSYNIGKSFKAGLLEKIGRKA